jgi:hypothetical protein
MAHDTAALGADRSTARPDSARGARARWSTLGGGGLVASFALLLVATLIEGGLLAAPMATTAMTWLFLALFVVSLALAVVAVVALAFGASGDDGIVGSSTLGKAGLVGYGVLWAATELVYLIATYLVGDASLLGISGVLGILMTVAAIIAAVVIAVKGVAEGVGRWSLIAAVVISGVVGGAASGTTDPATVTVLHCISAAAMLLVGVSYLADRGATRGPRRA